MNRKYLVAHALIVGMGVLLPGCSKSSTDQENAGTPQANATTPEANATSQHPKKGDMFGGPSYTGAPVLKATAALVKAGGGAEDFSFSTALVSMLGEKTVNGEVAKLTKQYGKEKVTGFIKGMTFAVKTALKDATAAGVKLPEPPADLKGQKLAEALVSAGTAPDGVWWAGYMFDKTLSHPIHMKVMQTINEKFSTADDRNTHMILNQAMYDVAQALGKTEVKLATLH